MFPRTRAARKAESAVVVWAALMLLSLAMSQLAFAGAHPVPLAKGITEDKCIECHEDLTKGKVVHAAVSMGCLNCHTVRGSGETTRVALKTPKSTALCGTCHADKISADRKSGFHPPVTVDCLQCHTPHHSETKALLKKATSGDKESNLCLKCHVQGLSTPEKGSRHAALESGCDTCHVTHKSGKENKAEFNYHLTKAVPALCVDCHDVKDPNLVKAHQGQPFGGTDCTNCHDPHQSKLPKLMQANVHEPFAGGCDTCHQAPENGKVKLVEADTKALCATCHDEVVKKIDSAKYTHPSAQADCTSCHDPHAGRFPKFIRPDPVTACDNCHSDQATKRNAAHVTHNPVEGQCSICHAAHGGDNPKLLRAKGDALCLECHGPDARGVPLSSDNTKIGIFNRAVLLPSHYLERTTHLPLANGKGHPLRNHPINGKDPSNPDQQISCVRCHFAHAGESKLLVTGTLASGPLCSQCHKQPK